MAKSKRLYVVAGLVVVLALAGIGAGAGIAIGAGGDDDKPITGQSLEDCTAAALVEHPGTVTETEGGDDGAAYGVEIQLADGSQVEVNLDENCNVIGQEADDDGAGDEDGAADDD